MAESDDPPEKEEPWADDATRLRLRNELVRAARTKRPPRSQTLDKFYATVDAARKRTSEGGEEKRTSGSESPPPPPALPPALTGGGGEGFGMTVRGGHREIPGYPVTDDDLENMDSDTEEMRTNLGVVSFCFSLIVTIALDGWLFATEVTPIGGAFRVLAPLVCVVIGVAFWRRYVHYKKQHTRRVDRIKKETRRAGQQDT